MEDNEVREVLPAPLDLMELRQLIFEATRQVEDELNLEDQGWIRAGTTSNQIITEVARIDAVKYSRLYYLKDPLCKQAIRLWTDYTFGKGMVWSCDDDKANEVLSNYWYSKANQPVLSARGQRRSSNKLLVDGEVYFALFFGKEVTVRLIDPLEISEIITDPDDRDDERYYKREWGDAQGGYHTDYYCSHRNPKNKAVMDSAGKSISKSKDAKNVLVYHLVDNTLGQRGMPLLLPALDWVKQYRRFLASRVAIMLALARFAWKGKVQGGAAEVATVKAELNDVKIPAGSTEIENEALNLTPIKADSGAKNAYQDARLIKLQVCSSVGIPEQYFGDISIGNLATAKTVELPMMKMFQSNQSLWNDAYQDMDELVLVHGEVAEDTHIDRDFPPISPLETAVVADALGKILTAMPEFSDSRDVRQVALMVLGINNTGDVLEEIDKILADQEKKKAEAPPVIPVPALGLDGQPLPPEQLAQAEALVGLSKALYTVREAVATVLKGGNNSHES